MSFVAMPNVMVAISDYTKGL